MSETSLIERAEKTMQEFKDHNVKIRYHELFERYNKLLKTQKKVDAIYSTLPIQYQGFLVSNVTLPTSLDLFMIQDIGLLQYYGTDYLQKECTRLENEIASTSQDIEFKIGRITSYTKNCEFESLSLQLEFPLGIGIDSQQTTLSSDSGMITALKNQIDGLEKELAEERVKSKQPRLTSKSDRLTSVHFAYPFSVGE